MIKASIAFSDTDKFWDAVVIGAGPAGSTIARLLSLSSRTVLLVDRADFPRDKVCGCCINDIAAGVLSKIGLEDLLSQQNAIPFSQLIVCESGIKARLQLPTGFALSRSKFDAALIRAAIASGVSFLPRVTARVQPSDESERLVKIQNTSDRNEVRAKLVIVADGLDGMSLSELPEFSTVAKENSKFGAGVVLSYADTFYEEGRIYMACSNHGYVGLVRIEDNKLDIAVALNRDFSRQSGSPALASAAILESAGLPVPAGFLTEHWTGTNTLTRCRLSLSGERLFLIGDACGYTEPFTGEGMSWALLAAAHMAPLADAAIEHWKPELAPLWRRQYLQLIGKKQNVSAVVAACLKRGGLRRLCLLALSAVPEIARPIVDSIAARKMQADLTIPDGSNIFVHSRNEHAVKN
ncbi:MAG: NAD(P)/FAD-dependent oxidoreductase [Candidatus Obscuribacterales bacterium]|nr:NAD(P)/FAD-dependent oxidoreductase [Candidatus Obscuribacterales bacterium]